ncbi:MAG: type II secretion system major pseudopilin GspG [Candidatus Omnitrophica bacterium]|nr:type II secretion system major pseudopilin GspG [Candidatus Omnitrophota bacterium]
MKIKSMLPRSAFTLVEIMLVVIIIGALAAMIIPRLSGRGEEAKTKVAKSDIDANLATALKLYELDNGSFPTSAQGLAALRLKPSLSPIPQNWNGPYIEKEPLDPWGRPYVYVSPGEHRQDYDLSSRGKDGTLDKGEISNWQ